MMMIIIIILLLIIIIIMIIIIITVYSQFQSRNSEKEIKEVILFLFISRLTLVKTLMNG